MKLLRTYFVLLAVALAASGQAQDISSLTNSISLVSITRRVLEENPALKAAEASCESMFARIAQVRAWPDPRVGVDVERRDTTRLDRFSDSEWMVSQELPVFRRNRERAEITKAEFAAAGAEMKRLELDLITRTRRAYYQLASAHAQLEINLRNAEVLKQLSQTSLDMFRLGRRMQGDVLMAETAMVESDESRRDLERAASDAESELNVLMNRRPDTFMPPPEPLRFETFNVRFEDIRTHALKMPPQLEAARSQAEAAVARERLARRAWLPDPEIRLEARQFSGRAGFQEYDTGIFFNFPWLNRGKYRGAIHEAKKDRERAVYAVEALQAETLGALHNQLKKIETLQHHYELFHGRILPLARQSAEASRTAYASEKGGFLEVLNVHRTLHNTEAATQQHLAEYLMAIAEFRSILGTDAPFPLSSSTEEKP